MSGSLEEPLGAAAVLHDIYANLFGTAGTETGVGIFGGVEIQPEIHVAATQMDS
jgi:hypothetical protein